MTDKLYVPVLDNSDDQSTVGIFSKDEGDFANQAAYDAAIQAFYDAVDDVSIGTLVEAYIVNHIDKITGSDTPPTNKFARRENRFVCQYTDTVNQKKYSYSIPCADLNLTTGDVVDLTSTEGAALKAAFEDIGQSELGNPVTLNAIVYRGATY